MPTPSLANLSTVPEDPILKLATLFAEDSREDKINVGIGAWRDENGKEKLFESVLHASEKFSQETTLSYLPIGGDLEFCQSVKSFVLASQDPRIGCVQTIGATGALSVATKLLKKAGVSKIAVSDPTWSNHLNIARAAGLEVITYPYYDKMRAAACFDEMLEAISKLEKGTALLLQPTCHNPTGIDLPQEMLRKILKQIRERELIPLFDMAYHCLKGTAEEDLEAFRLFLNEGQPMLISYSFSKHFGLYGERVGALFTVAENEKTREITEANIRQIIRADYSTPPRHGSFVVKTILNDQKLLRALFNEHEMIRNRIKKVRLTLADTIPNIFSNPNLAETISQGSGFFTLLPLDKESVHSLQKEQGIYMPSSGRISIPGLTEANIPLFLEKLESAFKR